jgi:hypothetical protein
MKYIEPRLARLARLAPCSLLPLYLNKARKWARFGPTQRISEELVIQEKE